MAQTLHLMPNIHSKLSDLRTGDPKPNISNGAKSFA